MRCYSCMVCTSLMNAARTARAMAVGAALAAAAGLTWPLNLVRADPTKVVVTGGLCEVGSRSPSRPHRHPNGPWCPDRLVTLVESASRRRAPPKQSLTAACGRVSRPVSGRSGGRSMYSYVTWVPAL